MLNSSERKEYAALESEIDEDFIMSHQTQLVEQERTKIMKKVERDNQATIIAAAESKDEPKLLSQAEIDERLTAADKLASEFKEENKTKLVPSKKTGIEGLKKQMEKLDDRIAAAKVQLKDRDENKTTALGTSKINYIDPRISVAWAKKHDVPISKLFTATLRTKFAWAMGDNVDADWKF